MEGWVRRRNAHNEMRRMQNILGCTAQVLPEQRVPWSRDLHAAQDNEKWVQTPRLWLAAATRRVP